MKEYRQSKTAIIISYVVYRWILAACTIGILAAFDYMRYKNTKIAFENKLLVFTSGAFGITSKEIPYEDSQSVQEDRSLLGDLFNYGSLIISIRNIGDTIEFKFLNNPDEVRSSSRNTTSTLTKLNFLNLWDYC